MAAPSTRHKLLSLIEDVEIITKELLEHLSTPKTQRAEGIDTSQLIELLVQKDKEVQDTLKTAKEQAELQKKLDSLKDQVDKRDNDIKLLQKNLKEAESILATAIYQARQKLDSIKQASKRKLSTDELIKYAHVISASHAVAAPPSWMPGDPSKRPYPLDLDMRRGWLAGVQTGDLPIPPPQQQHQQHQQQQQQHHHQQAAALATAVPSWQHPATDMHQGGMGAMQHIPGHGGGMQHIAGHGGGGGGGGGQDQKGGRPKDHQQQQQQHHEDVEMMSSDSSSSSSSDE